MYELFDHTADIGIRLQSTSRDELFVEGAAALASLLIAVPADVMPSTRRELSWRAETLEFAFRDWLGELIYLFEVEHFVWSSVAVRELEPGNWEGCLMGETFDEGRHGRNHEVKAVTYHELAAGRSGEGWQATVILDI